MAAGLDGIIAAPHPTFRALGNEKNEKKKKEEEDSSKGNSSSSSSPPFFLPCVCVRTEFGRARRCLLRYIEQSRPVMGAHTARWGASLLSGVLSLFLLLFPQRSSHPVLLRPERYRLCVCYVRDQPQTLLALMY